MSAAVKSVVRRELELGVGRGPLKDFSAPGANPQATRVEPDVTENGGDAERKRATDPAGPRVNSVLSGFPEGPWLLGRFPSVFDFTR